MFRAEYVLLVEREYVREREREVSSRVFFTEVGNSVGDEDYQDVY